MREIHSTMVPITTKPDGEARYFLLRPEARVISRKWSHCSHIDTTCWFCTHIIIIVIVVVIVIVNTLSYYVQMMHSKKCNPHFSMFKYVIILLAIFIRYFPCYGEWWNSPKTAWAKPASKVLFDVVRQKRSYGNIFVSLEIYICQYIQIAVNFPPKNLLATKVIQGLFSKPLWWCCVSYYPIYIPSVVMCGA